MTRVRKMSLLLGLLVAVAGVACGDDEGDAAGQQQAFEVQAFDFYFEPTSLQFQPGAEVTLTLDNVGSVAHSITVPDLDFEAVAEGGESIENSFVAPTTPGSLDFFCKFHPDEMTGTISIGGVGQPLEEDVDTPPEDDPDVEVEVEDDTEDDTTTGEY